MSGSLVSFKNFGEGNDESICLSLRARGDSHHSLFQVFLSFVLWRCIAADLLYFNCFLRIFGSSEAGDVMPSAAAFASLSAFSLPSILTCPAVHLSVSE